MDLLKTRLRGMYDHLPTWLKVRAFNVDNDHEWELSTGSRVLAFPTTAGDSYTATLAVVDEADLLPDLDRLMRAVKPTIDGGGRMVLLSRADKGKPQSPFKKIYTAARQKLTNWVPLFLPWSVRPGRDAAWYESQKADILHRTGCLDDLAEQYPATDTEALAPRTLDKRIAPEWLQQCLDESPGRMWENKQSHDRPPPAIPGFVWYIAPKPRGRYVIGADPAEGNPTSDQSAATVLDADTGEEAASLAGLYQPEVFGAHINSIGCWYNNAPVLAERNNHGHALLLWLRDHSRLARLVGYDQKPGWLSNTKGKALLYDRCAEAFREQKTKLHSWLTYCQLASIEGASLRAPEGEADDRADSYALALMGKEKAAKPQTFAPYRCGGYPQY